ncbi:MAG TPA: RIP metalloprotease RseP [Firmicutes bacterium]|nr:RIP metalloprotease RseP [Bacillota bacterium]
MLLTIVSFIIVFSLFAFVHEFGHFIVGKLSGIKVLEFSLGFGPRFFRFQRGSTVYSLRLLPLGAFVKFAGLDRPEDPAEDIRDDDPASFRNKPILTRIATVFAGPFMNFVAALVILGLIFSVNGLPTTEVQSINPGSPAERGGMLAGDRIVEIAGARVRSVNDVRERVMTSAGKEIAITVERDGQRISCLVIPEKDPATGNGLIGVTLKETWEAAPLKESIAYAWDFTRKVTVGLVQTLYQIVSGRARPEVAGPLGIAQMVGQTARLGFINLLFLTALLNINLGILNLLPIPILDGGWILMLLVEAIRRKPLTESQEAFARLIGIATLGLIFLFATMSDISRITQRLM